MGSVEQRIRELASSLRKSAGFSGSEKLARSRAADLTESALLREQPEARGVVIERDNRGLISAVYENGKLSAANPEYVVDTRTAAQPQLEGGGEDDESVDRCESALPTCGPAVAWDEDGIGACERCAKELGWLAQQAAPPSAPVGVEGLLSRAYEAVRHGIGCPAIKGNGDADCDCGAVTFLRDLECALTQQPAQAAPGDGLGWEENVSYLLDRCPHAVRVREGGGPESLVQSLIVTFMKLEKLATGSLHGLHHPTGAEAMTPDVALLPCPFCGGRAKSKSEFVRCVECGAQMNFGDEDGLDSIISSWNRRSDAALASARAREEELRAEVEAIAVELDEFADCPARVLTLAGKLRALSTNAAKPGETT